MEFKNCIRIMKKDWKGTIQNKNILVPMIFIHIIFTVVVPILMMIGVIMAPEEYTSTFGSIDVRSLLNIPLEYNKYLVAAIFVIKMMIMPLFLLIPALLPTIISADSFAGEKERKTMESIALLPITKTELIVGKVFTAFFPSIVINMIFFGILGLMVNIIMISYLQGQVLIYTDLTFILIVFVLAPLIAFLNILICVIISSRSKDLKSAQSTSGALVTPIFVLLIAQIINPAFLSPISVLIFSGILAGLCLLFVNIANRLLDIEKLILML